MNKADFGHIEVKFVGLQQDMGFETELWRHYRDGDQWRTLGEISLDSSHFQYSELFPNLLKVLAISKTLLVSTATVERSFSAMNRILSWARNSLDFSLASDFMLLSMKKDI